MGDLPGAEAPLQEGLHLSQVDFGATSVESGHALWALGMLRHQQGRFNEAKDLYVRSLGILETRAAPQNRRRGRARRSRQSVRARGALGAGEANLRSSAGNLPPCPRRGPPAGGDASQRPWPSWLRIWGDLRQAENLYRESIRLHELAYGEQHPETCAVKGNYGLLLLREGRLAEAEPQLRNALQVARSFYGPDNYNMGYARVSLGMLLHDQEIWRHRKVNSARRWPSTTNRCRTIIRGALHCSCSSQSCSWTGARLRRAWN